MCASDLEYTAGTMQRGRMQPRPHFVVASAYDMFDRVDNLQNL